MIFSAVAPIFLVIAVGVLLRRTRVLTAEADRMLLRVVVNILYPCFIASRIIGNELLQEGINVWLPPLVGLLTLLASYAITLGGGRLLGMKGVGVNLVTFSFVTALYNYGYTAIPLVERFFGEKTLGVLFTHNLGVELGFWVGAALLLARGSTSSEAEEPLWKRLLSMPVIAIIASLGLNMLGAETFLPEWVLGGAGLLGGAAIPMALLLTGATLADFAKELGNFREGLKPVLGASVLRLGLLPLLFLALARWLPGSIELKQVLVVQAAMPCAMFPIILCKLYRGNTAMAVQIVIATTALSLLTIPYWISFGLRFAGLPPVEGL